MHTAVVHTRNVYMGCRHWEYELHKLDILSVDVEDDGRSAVILAALQVCIETYSNPGKEAC